MLFRFLNPIFIFATGALWVVMQTGPDPAGKNLCLLVQKAFRAVPDDCIPSFDVWGSYVVGAIFLGAVVLLGTDIGKWIRKRTGAHCKFVFRNRPDPIKKEDIAKCINVAEIIPLSIVDEWPLPSKRRPRTAWYFLVVYQTAFNAAQPIVRTNPQTTPGSSISKVTDKYCIVWSPSLDTGEVTVEIPPRK